MNIYDIGSILCKLDTDKYVDISIDRMINLYIQNNPDVELDPFQVEHFKFIIQSLVFNVLMDSFKDFMKEFESQNND